MRKDWKSLLCTFPREPANGTKIVHPLFSYISKNWRARPLISYQIIIKLISSTKQRLGSTLNVRLTMTITEQESKSVTTKCARSTYPESVPWKVELSDRPGIKVSLFYLVTIPKLRAYSGIFFHLRFVFLSFDRLTSKCQYNRP